MKKRIGSNLKILEFIIFISILLIVFNLALFTNSFGGPLDKIKNLEYKSNNAELSKLNYQQIPPDVVAEKTSTANMELKTISEDSPWVPEHISFDYFSDFDIPTKKNIDKDLKKKSKNKKNSKKKIKVIIEAKSEEKLNKISKAIKETGGDVDAELNIGNSVVANIPTDKLNSLANDEDVKGMYADRVYNMLLDTSIQQINIPSAWKIGYNGSGIKIAVLDTGIDDKNEMITGKVVLSEVFTGEDHTDDKQGHGTHIAGIIAGNGQYKGVAPGALLMNAKVLTDSGSGSTSTIIQGINWAVENNADIISMSLGGPHEESDGPINVALREAIDVGVIVVISAGNCGEACPSGNCGDFRGVTKPGDFEDAITVGAVDNDNKWACFSSGQKFEDYIKPDLVAPGVNITSSYVGNKYQTLSGTSISAPFVSGVAALMLQKNSSLQQHDLKSILEKYAIDLGVEGKDIEYGSGLVDVEWLFLTIDDSLNLTPIINDTIDKPENNASLNESEGDTIEDYEGFYISVPLNINNSNEKIEENERIITENSFTASESSFDIAPSSEINIKVRNSSVNVIADGERPISSLESEPSQFKTAAIGSGRIDYDDDYTYKAGDGDDGVVWGGGDLDVGVDGEESGTMVICYDWNDEWPFDNCYADSSDDFEACWDASQTLFDICSQKNRCWSGGDGKGGEHIIDTGNSGDRWKQYTGARYYRNCDQSEYEWADTYYEPYYVVSPRQYKCTNEDSGGTYEDGAFFSSNTYVLLKEDIDCSGNFVCDEDKDDSNADFGSNGGSEPSAPCSLPDGKSDCDNDNQCFSGSHCSQVFGADYCCPIGQEWDGSKCSSTCTEGWLDEYQCSVDMRQRKWQDGFCNTEWKEYKNCNDNDNTGDWEYSCPNADKVEKKRDITDGYCDKDTNSCKITSNEEKETVSQNGDGDFCSKRKDYSCSLCAYEKYDCDFDNQCSSSAPDCVDDDGGTCGIGKECACCNIGERWDGNSCEAIINCEMSSSSWSTSSATEGDSVTLTVTANSDCNGKTASFNVWELDCGFDYSATADCKDEDVNNNPSSTTFSNGKATTTWTAEWQNDGIGDPEYYFIVTVDSETIRSNSPELSVTKKCNPQDYKQCYNGNVHWFDSCDNREDPAKETCNSQDKCVNNGNDDASCEWKTCEELGYEKGSCTDVTDSDCKGDAVYECNDARSGIAIQACYVFSHQCTSEQFCKESWPSASCQDYQCTLTNSYWDKTEVKEGEDVLITIEGNYCDNGDDANVKIMEVDEIFSASDFTAQGFWDWLPGNDDDVEDLGQKIFSNGKIETTWTAKYIEDYDTPMNTYRIASKNEYSELYEGDLIINSCEDNDGDGYKAKSCGGNDCNDNNSNVNPGAAEVCNGVDDNCKNGIDEGVKNIYYKDADRDSYGDNDDTTLACTLPSGYVTNNNDCNDNNTNINPGASESCNEYDDDCDLEIDEDFELNDDINNCGACGISCNTNELCNNGVCEIKLVCDNDNICEPGENENNCANDCGCNNNDVCEAARGESSLNCANDCSLACNFPNGKSWNCECDSDVECLAHGDYYCNQVSGPDACEAISYNDECSNYNDYFCENGNVKQCVNNGKYYEKKNIESCSGKYKYCDPEVVDGTQKCSKHPQNLDVWIDYADTGVVVNKIPGDKLKLNIYSDNSATVKISFDKDVFVSNDCFAFHAIVSGVNTCNLVVNRGVEDSNHEIKVDGTIKQINIINNPEILIITDSEKLNQEYYQEPNAVKAVLKQAYANAEKDNGVVYDLSWYKSEIGVSNPFDDFR